MTKKIDFKKSIVYLFIKHFRHIDERFTIVGEDDL